MKRIMGITIGALCLTCLLSVSVYGQYVAPNEDTVVVVGGLGTQADKAQLNGGGATKVVWDAGSPSDFIAVNGGPITADTGITYDHTANGNGERNLAKAGIGSGVTVGTLAYVSGTNITTGVYEITAVDGAGAWINCANIVATGDNADSVVNTGGALASLQGALDNSVNNGASYNRFIFDNISTETITAKLDIDTFTGSASTRIKIVGYNATLAAEAQVTLVAGDDMATLVQFANNASNFIKFHNFIFDADGTTRAITNIIVAATTTDDFVTFVNCIFDDADGNAIACDSDYWTFIGCECMNCVDGLTTKPNDGLGFIWFGNSVHDNSGVGIEINANTSVVLNNLVYDNGGIGIELSGSPHSCVIVGNTVYINDGDNISIASSAYHVVILNNVCVGSTAGYGFNFNGGSPFQHAFGYNLSASNNSGDMDYTGTTFTLAGWGNNVDSAQAADAIFKTITDGSEDFTPETGSDLIDAAADTGVN